MATPASRWRPSSRRFQPSPADWEYDAHQMVKRLSANGQLSAWGYHFEISNALRHQWVGVELLGERAIVFFRRTPMRELDLKTGRSFPIPLDFSRSLQG